MIGWLVVLYANGIPRVKHPKSGHSPRSPYEAQEGAYRIYQYVDSQKTRYAPCRAPQSLLGLLKCSCLAQACFPRAFGMVCLLRFPQRITQSECSSCLTGLLLAWPASGFWQTDSWFEILMQAGVLDILVIQNTRNTLYSWISRYSSIFKYY